MRPGKRISRRGHARPHAADDERQQHDGVEQDAEREAVQRFGDGAGDVVGARVIEGEEQRVERDQCEGERERDRGGEERGDGAAAAERWRGVRGEAGAQRERGGAGGEEKGRPV